MSPKTKSKVKQYVSTWVNACEEITKKRTYPKAKKLPYLTFVTLTLPSKQGHEDNEIKRTCLIPFIQTLQRKYNVWNYFWRAEAQKNNNIHFHLIIDSYIDHISLKGEWNKCINKLQYVDEFEKKHGHTNPNSTDIHKLNDIHNSAAYLIKYVSKTDGYRPIQGRIHGCSDRVRVLKPYTCEIDNEVNDFIKTVLYEKDTYVHKTDQYQLITYIHLYLRPEVKRKFDDRIEKYNLNIGMDLYTNREASFAETAEAEMLISLEAQSKEMVQLDLMFNIDGSSAFFGSPNW